MAADGAAARASSETAQLPPARRSRTCRRSPAAPKPDPILVADGVRRHFGGIIAVDVDHVEVQRGSITALIGPNGAGKTTFFNLLTGFDEPERRRLGRSTASTMTASPPHKTAKLGMVRTFQLTKSLTKLPVIENMKLGATGPARREVVERSDPVAVAGAGGARSRRAPTSCSRGSSSTTCATSTPARCRAVSASCSRWRGR